MNDFKVNTPLWSLIVDIVELDIGPPLRKRSVTPMAKAGIEYRVFEQLMRELSKKGET
jgi:hypothetical protein